MSSLKIKGNAAGAGTTTLQSANTSSSATFTLPATDGTNGQLLKTDGSGNLAFTSTLSGSTIEAATFTNGYTEEVATANTSSAYTIDLANGSFQILTLTANATITMPTATAGRSFILLLKQDGTGSRTVTWSSVRWPGGTAPTLTTTASRQDIFSFFSDGTNWYGATAGQNYTP